MRLAPIALSLGFALLPLAASAQESAPARGVFKTGDDLYAACTATDSASIDRCDWFLMGAQDMATYYQDTDQVKTSFCLPAGTNAEALRKLAVDRLRANPNTRRYSAVSGFLNALDEAYPGPCKA
jgi:hypothetical protein